MIGELSLDGSVRPVNGVLSVVLMAQRTGDDQNVSFRAVNAFEGAAVDDIEVYGVHTLTGTDWLPGRTSAMLRRLISDREALLDRVRKSEMPTAGFQ